MGETCLVRCSKVDYRKADEQERKDERRMRKGRVYPTGISHVEVYSVCMCVCWSD